MSLLMSPDNPMNPKPFPLRPPSGNDVLDEIDAAHEQLSPAAKQAVGMSGLPQRMEVAAAPAPASAPAMPSPAPVEQTPRLISRPAPPRSLTPNPKMEADAAKVASLEAAKPGVDTIHNPVLRTLGKIGDVAGTMFLGGNMALIPGTTLHHQRDLNQAREALKGSQEAANDEANREHLEALSNEARVNADLKLNPPAKYGTPFVTKDGYAVPQEGSPTAVPLTVNGQQAQPRPEKEPQANINVSYAAAVDKAVAEGRDPATDPVVIKYAAAIREAQKSGEPNRDDRAIALMQKQQLKQPLTPDETAYLAAWNHYVDMTKLQPGLQRAQVFVNGRVYPVLDSSGNLGFATLPEIKNGGFSPAAQSTQAMSKDAIFRSMYYTVGAARKAFQELGTMDAETRAQMALALEQQDPTSAVGAFLHGAVGSRMNPKQREVVQTLLSLAEDAMTLRGVAGMGQGSDELRAAIKATIPSGNTADVPYALGQLDKFEQLARRLHEGVPGTAVNPKQPNGGGSAGAPPVGTVVNGYRYKGGNHRDQANWEKVK